MSDTHEPTPLQKQTALEVHAPRLNALRANIYVPADGAMALDLADYALRLEAELAAARAQLAGTWMPVDSGEDYTDSIGYRLEQRGGFLHIEDSRGVIIRLPLRDGARLCRLTPGSPAITREEVGDTNTWSDETVRQCIDGMHRHITQEAAGLLAAAENGLALAGGWQEAITELEDWCSEPVRLKNMVAAADQLDNWVKELRAAVAAVRGEGQG